jgi:cardiolipin synthase (CMP-forming)
MVSNAITIFRTVLTLPLFLLLAFGGNAWAALALFLGAGALDMVDGKVARARNETSAFGAMIDLVGDRLLTFAAVTGLVVGGAITGVVALAGLVLIVRDLIVASLNEALPDKLGPRVGLLEKIKIAAAFAGMALLIAAIEPSRASMHQIAETPTAPDAGWGSGVISALMSGTGEVLLGIAALLTLVTLVQYWMRALRAFKGS